MLARPSPAALRHRRTTLSRFSQPERACVRAGGPVRAWDLTRRPGARWGVPSRSTSMFSGRFLYQRLKIWRSIATVPTANSRSASSPRETSSAPTVAGRTPRVVPLRCARRRASMASRARSASTWVPVPERSTFTATDLPSASRARWTWSWSTRIALRRAAPGSCRGAWRAADRP